MKIMSVDYGDARTGVAFCDEREILASPYTVIRESRAPELVKKLRRIIDECKPELVVIGMPRNMDGSYGFRADKCRALGEMLTGETSVGIEYEDERLTTVISHSILSSNNASAKKRKKEVDAVSAAVILQSFIDKRK